VRKEHERVNHLVECLLADKRLPRSRVSPEELEAIGVAIWLRAARPGSELPDRAFMERLGRKLRAELDDVQPAPPRFTRRGIIRSAAVAAGAVVAGAAVDRLQQRTVAFLTPQALVPDTGSWRAVVTASALPVGRAIRFSTGDVDGILVNEVGRVRAFSGMCTHLGCVLTINARARTFDCPCHDLAFSWNGSVHHYRLQERPPALPEIRSRVREATIEVLVP
jgi:cytochrome b6-f complex iron-sulfur subunit